MAPTATSGPDGTQLPDHPDADIITKVACAECGLILSERSTPIGATHSHRETPPSPVDVLVPSRSDSLVSGHDGEEQAERASNILPMTPRTIHGPQVLPEFERRDMEVTGNCSECREYTVKRRRSGVWTCGSCSAVLLVEPWVQDAPPRPQERPDYCPTPGDAPVWASGSFLTVPGAV